MLYWPRNKEELSFIKDILKKWLELHSSKQDSKDDGIQEKITKILPYSVEALKQLNFSWHSLSLEAIENDTSSYTRYRIFYMSNWYRISGILNIPKWDWPFPLIILNHGYIDPAVYTVWRWLKREQDYLARQSFAVLHTDYRNHGLSDDDPTLFENYIFRNYFYTQDAINSILAVKESSLTELNSIDTESIGMLWHSMWWWITLHALIAQPDLIDAALLYAPVHSTEWFNFNRWREDSLSEEERRKRIQILWSLDIEGFIPYSATPYVDKIQAPIQIYFWTDDRSVPYQRWVETNNILTTAWVESELIMFTWENHEFSREWNTFMEWTTSFFNLHLDRKTKN
jgi:pimeloyl-ACP methyl ester carboxylesterase